MINKIVLRTIFLLFFLVFALNTASASLEMLDARIINNSTVLPESTTITIEFLVNNTSSISALAVPYAIFRNTQSIQNFMIGDTESSEHSQVKLFLPGQYWYSRQFTVNSNIINTLSNYNLPNSFFINTGMSNSTAPFSDFFTTEPLYTIVPANQAPDSDPDSTPNPIPDDTVPSDTLFFDTGEIMANGNAGSNGTLAVNGGWEIIDDRSDERDSFYSTARDGATPVSGNLMLFVHGTTDSSNGYHPLQQTFDFDLSNKTIELKFFDFDGSLNYGALIASVRNDSDGINITASNDSSYYDYLDFTSSSVRRARGWHTLQFIIGSDGKTISSYLDGVHVETRTLSGSGRANKLLFSPKLYPFAYDDILVYAGLPSSIDPNMLPCDISAVKWMYNNQEVSELEAGRTALVTVEAADSCNNTLLDVLVYFGRSPPPASCTTENGVVTCPSVVVPQDGVIANFSGAIQNNTLSFPFSVSYNNDWINPHYYFKVQQDNVNLRSSSNLYSLPFISCQPTSCPEGFLETGSITCEGDTCTRHCVADQCSSNWQQVYQRVTSTNTLDEIDGSTSVSYNLGNYVPNNTDACYKFELQGTDYFIDSSSDDADNDYSCASFLTLYQGTSWRNPWYGETGNACDLYDAPELGEHKFFVAGEARGTSCQMADHLNTTGTLYCTPSSFACNDLGVNCASNCYGESTDAQLEIGIYPDNFNSNTEMKQSYCTNPNTADNDNKEINRLRFEDNKQFVYTVSEAPLVPVNQNQTCNSSGTCQEQEISGRYCSNNGDVVKNYRLSNCSTETRIIDDCNNGCSNGVCLPAEPACYDDFDCQDSGYESEPYCLNNNVVQDYGNGTCENPGSAIARCEMENDPVVIDYCGSTTCSNGECIAPSDPNPDPEEPLPDPDPIPDPILGTCRITNAGWSVLQADYGETVSLSIETNTFCEGVAFTADILENDLIGDDFVETLSLPPVINNRSSVNWETKWERDVVGNPEYIFDVTFAGALVYENRNELDVIMPDEIELDLSQLMGDYEDMEAFINAHPPEEPACRKWGRETVSMDCVEQLDGYEHIPIVDEEYLPLVRVEFDEEDAEVVIDYGLDIITMGPPAVCFGSLGTGIGTTLLSKRVRVLRSLNRISARIVQIGAVACNVMMSNLYETISDIDTQWDVARLVREEETMYTRAFDFMSDVYSDSREAFEIWQDARILYKNIQESGAVIAYLNESTNEINTSYIAYTGPATTSVFTTDDPLPGYTYGIAPSAYQIQTMVFMDSDGDFVEDRVDNCPDIANPTQADNDRDYLGDACDLDDDNDKVADAFDNCPFTTNHNQLDEDNDTIGDACDSEIRLSLSSGFSLINIPLQERITSSQELMNASSCNEPLVYTWNGITWDVALSTVPTIDYSISPSESVFYYCTEPSILTFSRMRYDEQPITFQEGFNFIGAWFPITESTTIELLLQRINTNSTSTAYCSLAYGFDNTFKVHLEGTTFNNFSVTPTTGIIFYCPTGGTINWAPENTLPLFSPINASYPIENNYPIGFAGLPSMPVSLTFETPLASPVQEETPVVIESPRERNKKEKIMKPKTSDRKSQKRNKQRK